MEDESFYEINIEELGLSVRTLELLKQAGIKNVKGVLCRSDELLSIFMNNKSGYNEIREELHGIGFDMCPIE